MSTNQARQDGPSPLPPAPSKDTTAPFEQLAFPFLPADDPDRGRVIVAPADWSMVLPRRDGGPDVTIWGRLPDAAGSVMEILRGVVAREAALRRIRRRARPGYRVLAIHRLPARQLATGVRGGLRGTIRAGAIVELVAAGATPPPRVLDRALEAAGARLTGSRIAFGSGGTLLARVELADGTRGLLRLARAGSPGDPARVGASLGRVADLGVPLAPRLLGQGTTAGGSWTVETELAGRRPGTLTPGLAGQAADVLSGFPRTDTTPRAIVDDLRAAADRLPARSTARAVALRRLADDLATEIPGLPAVVRHGDFWTGNLLVDEGAIRGVVDWDAAAPDGLPGADLIQVVATDLRRRRHRSLGAAFLGRPWEEAAFRDPAARYWPAVGIDPTPRLIELAGIAWWAAEVNGTLSRLPHRADDEAWLRANVDPVVASLGY